MNKINLYKTEKNLLLASFALLGFGNYIAGVRFPLEYSTFLIFIVLVLLIISGTIKFNKFLCFVLLAIAIQTFLINSTNLTDPRIISHFIGITLLVLTAFSFVSYFRDKLFSFVISYYKLVYYISLFSLFQIVIFLLLDVSIIPQNFITGQLQTGSPIFIPQIFEILPRNLGLSTEPANFAFTIIPGVYLALFQLLKKEKLVPFPRRYAFIILISIVLTFSVVSYFGVLIALFFLLKNKIFKNIKAFVFSILLILSFSYLSFTSVKLNDFVNMSTEFSDGNIETRSFTAFAMISNFAVAIESQKENHFIGSGLNTHLYNYEKHIYDIFSYSNVELEINKENGASLFLRILSEFGIPGLLALFIFIICFKSKRGATFSKYQIINEMALVTILLFCTRSGNYASISFLLFVAIYYFSYLVIKTQSTKLENRVKLTSNIIK